MLNTATRKNSEGEIVNNSVTLTMAAMQWADLKDLHDVEPLNEGDYECLAEVRDVLKKHNKRDRFGVALLHKHFDVANDEVLMENSDEDHRVLTIKPVKRNIVGKTFQTIWRLLDGEKDKMLDCQQDCDGGVHGPHLHD